MQAEFTTADVEPDHLAAIIYTSGTTGRSKGAMVTHRNLSSNARTLVEYWGFSARDVLLHALPIFHVHGLFVANHCALLSGARMLWHRRFDAKAVLRDLPRATVLMGVPTFYTRLLAEPAFGPAACQGVRLFISGSAPLLMETFQQFEARMGQRILERYGMSEAGMITSNPLDGERRGGTVGLPLPGVSVRIADDEDRPLPQEATGSIQIRGSNVFRGYWRMPEKTREEFTADGWFRTGDVGKLDAQGYLSIVGRAKDLIITGGYNVYPKEIELVIDAMPGVLESAVIGLPHPDFGEAVTAVVVARAGAELSETADHPAREGAARQLQGSQARDPAPGPAAQRHGQGAEERPATTLRRLTWSRRSRSRLALGSRKVSNETGNSAGGGTAGARSVGRRTGLEQADDELPLGRLHRGDGEPIAALEDAHARQAAGGSAAPGCSPAVSS